MVVLKHMVSKEKIIIERLGCAQFLQGFEISLAYLPPVLRRRVREVSKHCKNLAHAIRSNKFSL